MTLPKSFPARPSLDSLRKQAKQLARDVAAGNADATARARAQLPKAELPLSLRDAQLVIAREYGFAGWRDLTAEALKRSGHGLEWATAEAERAIHDDDLELLKSLLAEYPVLLKSHSVLLSATSSFGDSFDPFRAQYFTRRACAEFLIDAGAPVTPDIWDRLIGPRAIGILQLLRDKGVLPKTLRLLAALGDEKGVRACFDAGTLRPALVVRDETATVNDAFVTACRFGNEAIASFLLDRCIALDPELGRNIDARMSRTDFISYLKEHPQEYRISNTPIMPWRAFILHTALSAIEANDLASFERVLQTEAWLLDESHIPLQVELIERACFTRDRAAFIPRLFAANPALLRRPAPPADAVIYALEYGNAHLLQWLTKIWPLPDDLPHAAATGNFARVKQWFNAAGEPALGNPADHYPGNHPRKREHLHWGPPTVQQVLDTALAWACMNRQLEIAAFLADHGADIDTDWSTHEPASILHELVFHDNYLAMQFLIDRGIDMTTPDYRWNATAEGWAYHAAKNERMVEFLADAQRRRNAAQ
ncbi:MAG TPA: hypothetical protein VKB34_16810 [Povalibacter sp.]|nr:hypothetical protein [Povalibacter sp.]